MVKEKMLPLYTPITVALAKFLKITTFLKNKLYLNQCLLIYSDSFQLPMEMNSVLSNVLNFLCFVLLSPNNLFYQ